MHDSDHTPRRTQRALLAAVLVAVLAPAARPQQSEPPPVATMTSAAVPDPTWLGTVQSLALDERVGRALELLRARDAEITALQVRMAEIPAPDFRAAARAALLADLFRAADLDDVRQDAIGNVIGVLPGADRRAPAVVLSAHLDTVFPELDSISVQRTGTVLRGPGVGDDAAGVAAIVAIARALGEARVPLRRDVVVVGTVGEEGEGDLRGVKHFFAAGLPPARVAAFLTLDLGSQSQIVNEGIGSRRLHVTVRGRGGHSWGDFGRPNPIHALARSIDAFLQMPAPAGVRSSYNVGVIEGGTGVNVIPEMASLRLDLRSEEPAALEQLERSFRAALEAGLARERDWSNGGALQLDVDVIGDRPVGRTSPDSRIVQAVVAAFASQNLPALLGTSSTDANLPMSLGVPAVALPHGCQGQEAHSRAEWCDTANRGPVLAAELLAVVAVAELNGPLQLRRLPTD
jgi:acetylornithine deacetylase/succinyl-diaminopimelate desuccinylase-like protein